MWGPFLEKFADRRTIRFDVPGTGRSGSPAGPMPVAAIADLAAAVLDDRQIERSDVVGFSYGGAVAQQMAFSHRARIRRLVLAATSCGIGAVPGSAEAMSSLATPLRYYSGTYFERTAAISYGGLTGRDHSTRQRMMAARMRLPPSAFGYAMQLLGCVGWSSAPFLAQIPHETLVISGDDDPLIPVVNARMLALAIPNARLEIVRDSGHLFLWDEAPRLGEAIGRFVNDPKPAN